MHMQRLRIALVFPIGFALLTLGPLAEHVAAAPDSTMPEWSIQTDEGALTRDLVAWADRNARLETPLGSARLRSPSVELRDDQLVFHGVVDAGWVTQPVALVASASVEEGRVLVHVRSARIGGFDLGQGVLHEAEQQMQDQLDHFVQTNQVVVNSVRVSDGRLVANGSHDGPQ
jgi:hypothetical protein